MRILYLIDHLGVGGAQAALADLVAGWPCPADALHVVGLGPKVAFVDRFQGLPHVTVSVLGHRRWNGWSVPAVWQQVRRERFDIVHAHLCKSVCVSLWSQPRWDVPVVVHVHNDMRYDWRLLRFALHRWQGRAAGIVAVSRHTAREAQHTSGIGGDKLHVIYNPTKCPAVAGDGGPRPVAAAVRAALGLRSTDFVIGFVGRLCPQKGVTYLLQALERLTGTRRDLVALVIGDGPLAGPLRDEVSRRGLTERVRFLGYRPDIARWLQAVDIAAFPSLYEGLPVALVEAMRLGTPVVASGVDGVPEVIHPEQTGLLTAPGDVDALCTAITRLADSPTLRRTLAAQAQVLADQLFDPARVGLQTRALYCALAG